MAQDGLLICRRCKVAAQGKLVDGQIDRITCPSCGVLVEGDSARKVYLDQARHYALKTAQDVLKRGLSKAGPIDYRPGNVKDPGGPFIIGKPNP